jgi:tetratricopeptide (TPR) repeat protein
MSPASEPAHTVVLLARVCAAVGDFAGAEEVLRQALAARPDEVVLLSELGWLWEGQGRLEEALGCYRAARARRPHLGVRLGRALVRAGLAANGRPADAAEGEAVLRDLVVRQPDNPGLVVHLAHALAARKDVEGAVACFQRAVHLDPKSALAHYNLGRSLYDKKDLEGAIACYRQAIALGPKFAPAHTNLGNVLKERGNLEGAIACYRQAIALDPKHALARTNLGLTLAARGDLAGGIACFRQAIAADPRYAPAHYSLGTALAGKGEVEEAIACFRKAIAADPKLAAAHTNLGVVLEGKGDVEGAIACYRQAIAADPKLARAHTNLGIALYGKKDVEGAIACFRKAIAINPKFALAHNNLGFALDAVGKQKEAIEAWRTAVRLEPRLAMTHYWLGKALLLQGRPSEALVSLGEAAKRLPAERARALRLPAERSQAERLSRLEKRLPDLLAGKDRLGDELERLALSELCRRRHRFAAAARFFAEAFAASPKRADDLQAGHRYNAACAAALAAAGKGQGAAKLDDKERATLRRQALDWLKADLAAWTKLLDKGAPQARSLVQRRLRHWQKDPDLAGLRDPDALARLPQDQRQAWGRLWADVADLLKRTHDPE